MSVKYDITSDYLIRANFRPIHAGDDYDHCFTVERAGLPLDLTSAKLWFTIKADINETDTEAMLQYSSDLPAEIEITDILNGKFVIHIAAIDTAEFEGTWNYDIKAKLSTDKILRIARGVIQFLPNITRATT